MRWKFGPVRDALLLVCGLALLAEETLGQPEPRALLIAVAAAMIGLPGALLADRKFMGTLAPSPEQDEPKQPTT